MERMDGLHSVLSLYSLTHWTAPILQNKLYVHLQNEGAIIIKTQHNKYPSAGSQWLHAACLHNFFILLLVD